MNESQPSRHEISTSAWLEAKMKEIDRSVGEVHFEGISNEELLALGKQTKVSHFDVIDSSWDIDTVKDCSEKLMQLVAMTKEYTEKRIVGDDYIKFIAEINRILRARIELNKRDVLFKI